MSSILPYIAPLGPRGALYLAVATPYMALGALLLAILALLLLLSLRRRLTRLALGRNGSLEESIAILSRDTKDLQSFRRELEQYLKMAESRLRSTTQGIGIVRFNPFHGEGSGGNQSFAIALLDEYHSGVVLSTLHARERVGIYAKPIENGKSTFELTAEEERALEEAKKKIAHHRKGPAA